MIKRIALIFCAFVLAVAFYACDLDNTATTSQTQEVSTTVAPTTSTATTTRPSSTVTTTWKKTTVTDPSVSMPNNNTAWANYIVDVEYNYIADRLTKTQKNNVKKMCATVGCKVTFGADYTKVTDAKKNVVYYSKDFGDDTIILEPDFGVLTLARRAGKETTFVYKGVTIFNFMNYIEQVEMSGFYHSAVSSTDYMNVEGIFVGNDANGNSVIIKLTKEMVIIVLTEV